MVPHRQRPMRSIQATLLFVVAWLSFALPAALLGDASPESSRVVTQARIAALPVLRTAPSAEDVPGGRASRTTTHSPWLGDAEAVVLVAGFGRGPRVRSIAAVLPADRRLKPYDATAPPAPDSIA
jgi:hypothetical protein